jgi:phospholipid transport system transporter-binding protein
VPDSLASIERRSEQQFLISGELTMQSVPALAETARTLLAQAQGELEVDLSGVSRADSAAIALLIDIQRQARRRKCGIRFRHLPEQLSQILRLSELHEILPI